MLSFDVNVQRTEQIKNEKKDWDWDWERDKTHKVQTNEPNSIKVFKVYKSTILDKVMNDK